MTQIDLKSPKLKSFVKQSQICLLRWTYHKTIQWIPHGESYGKRLNCSLPIFPILNSLRPSKPLISSMRVYTLAYLWSFYTPSEKVINSRHWCGKHVSRNMHPSPKVMADFFSDTKINMMPLSILYDFWWVHKMHASLHFLCKIYWLFALTRFAPGF